MDDTWYEHEGQWKHLHMHNVARSPTDLSCQKVDVISVVFSYFMYCSSFTPSLVFWKQKVQIISTFLLAQCIFPDSFHVASVLVLLFFIDPLFAREHFCQFYELWIFSLFFKLLFDFWILDEQLEWFVWGEGTSRANWGSIRAGRAEQGTQFKRGIVDWR